MMPRRMLVLTRSLQPTPGGMQSYMHSLLTALSASPACTVTVIGHRGGNAMLPFFMVRAVFGALFFCGDGVHLGDASLSPLLPILRFLRPRLRRSITVYGLDLIWEPPAYQWMLRQCLPAAQRVVAISRATAKEAAARGVDSAKISIIPCGIEAICDLRSAISGIQPKSQQLIANSQKPRLLLFGRQIRRKGTVWFLSEVAPTLLTQISDLRIVIAGDGLMLPEIRSTVDRLGLGSVVSVLGEISDLRKDELYLSCSLFVMPNIPVADDMEGFGMVCIEAASYGLPIVASKLEGIADAVIDGETGLFFEPLNAGDASAKIIEALNRQWDQQRIQQICLEHFDSEIVATRYMEEVFG